MLQLDAQHCRLQFVHAAVQPLIDVMVASVGAIVCEGSDSVGKRLVVCGHGPGIAHRPDIFCGIETESRRIAESAGYAGAVQASARGRGTYCLRVVLHNLEIVFPGYAGKRIRPARCAVKMHHHDGACTLRDALLYF